MFKILDFGLPNNTTLIQTAKGIMLVSYQTPVALYEFDTKTIFKTTEKYSKTTTKHVKIFVENLSKRYPVESVTEKIFLEIN